MTKRHIGALIGVAAALTIGVMLYRNAFLFGGGYRGGHMGPGMIGFGTGGMMLVFWGLVLLGLILIINWLLSVTRNEHSESPAPQDAAEALKLRYARGEIDREQFKTMMRDISR